MRKEIAFGKYWGFEQILYFTIEKLRILGENWTEEVVEVQLFFVDDRITGKIGTIKDLCGTITRLLSGSRVEIAWDCGNVKDTRHVDQIDKYIHVAAAMEEVGPALCGFPQCNQTVIYCVNYMSGSNMTPQTPCCFV